MWRQTAWTYPRYVFIFILCLQLSIPGIVCCRMDHTRLRATSSSCRRWKIHATSWLTHSRRTFHQCCPRFSTWSAWSGSIRSSTTPRSGLLVFSERSVTWPVIVDHIGGKDNAIGGVLPSVYFHVNSFWANLPLIFYLCITHDWRLKVSQHHRS